MACFDFGVCFDDNDTNSFNEVVQHFLTANRAKETHYNTTTHTNRLKLFMVEELNDHREFWGIPAAELDHVLSQFFMKAKKINKSSINKLGELYQPDTLSNMRNAWQRVLEDKGSKLNIKTDPSFVQSRKVLSARRKQLTQKGLGNKPLATRPLTDDEVQKLFSTGYFGIENPLSLQRAMWWKITVNFGYRARDEARKLKFRDLKLSTDENGLKYLEWDKERGTKTRTGEKHNSHQRAFNPKAVETPDEYCPIRIYEEFIKRRPEESKTTDSPFFLAMVPDKNIRNDKPWYFNRPLGKNMIGDFLKKSNAILQNSSSSRSKIANHSARKTCISTLLDKDVNPIHVAQLSGHKNIESLKSYHCASINQQKEMSSHARTALIDRGLCILPYRHTNSQYPEYQKISIYYKSKVFIQCF